MPGTVRFALLREVRNWGFNGARRRFETRFGVFPAWVDAHARNILTDAAYRGMFRSVNQEQSRRPEGRRFAMGIRGTIGTF